MQGQQSRALCGVFKSKRIRMCAVIRAAAPVRFGALKRLRGTSQRPGAPILVRRMKGEMFSTVSVKFATSGPSSGTDPFPRSRSSPTRPLSARGGGRVGAGGRSHTSGGAGAREAAAQEHSACAPLARAAAPEGENPPTRLYALAPLFGRKQAGTDSGAPRLPTVLGSGAKQQPRALHAASVTPFQPARRGRC